MFKKVSLIKVKIDSFNYCVLNVSDNWDTILNMIAARIGLIYYI